MDIHLLFDGGNGASKEKEAYGSYYYTLGATEINYLLKRISFGVGFTSNESEYKTLIVALEHLIAWYTAGDITLHIRGDSELVRNQIGTYTKASHDQWMNGSPEYVWNDVWQVRKKHLKPYRDKARELLQQFKSFTYAHIPRAEVVKVLGH